MSPALRPSTGPRDLSTDLAELRAEMRDAVDHLCEAIDKQKRFLLLLVVMNQAVLTAVMVVIARSGS